jgi:hypothetical protein
MAKKKLRTIWDNRFFDLAALTPSSEVAELPARRVQDRQRQLVWRTTGCAAEYLLANLGTPRVEEVRPAVTAVALINHNLTRRGQVTVQASSTPEFDNLLLNEIHDAWAPIAGAGATGAGGPPAGPDGLPLDDLRDWYAPNPVRILYLEGAPLEARDYWKLIFADPDNPDGFIQVGRIYISYFDEHLVDWGWPWDLGGEDQSEITYTPGGNPWTDKKAFLRTLRFGWNQRFREEDLFWRFWLMVMKMGLHTDWLIDPIPDGVSSRHFTTLYGRFQEIPSPQQWLKGLSDLEIQFIESL